MFHSRSQVPGDGVIVGSAQTLAAAALEAIGKIRTASGSVTVMRADGEIVRVSVGDLVYRGDTIETEADGAVGITFADGTAFDLSAAARLVLNEFVCDPAGTPNSALFSLVQGAFAFVAGKVAKTGGLRIDTPFASIRGSAQDRGVGVLTLAALTFAAIEESQAASRHDAFLDDGTITYKDLAHGTFEIVTRDGRVVVADDPGETIVVDPTGSVSRIPNSSSRMAELQQAQHSALATFSLGQEGGAAGGSSSPGFDIPVQLQPINFGQPHNDAPTEIVTTHITAASSGFIPVLQQLNPPPPVVTPVLGSAGFSMVTEAFNITGSTHFDTVSSGTLTFTDFQVTTVSATMASMTWSGGATPPSGLAEVLAGALSITTESANPFSGSIATTFSAVDRNFDFLAANETLTIVYDVTVTDNEGVSLTRPVTITITGTNDAPVLAADASGPHAVTEGFNTTGTFAFTDVDLTDHHTVSTSVTSATWSGGATLPSGLAGALAGALSTTASDGTGSGSGSIAVTFSAADSAFDFLASGETLKITYNVTVSDNTGASSTQPVTITVTGTNDAPVITAQDLIGAVTEQITPAGNLTDSGTITFTDVDLTDVHLVSSTGTPIGSVLGTLTAVKNTDTTGTGASGQLTWTYTIADSAVEYLAKDQTKVESFTITLDDQHGGLITKQIDVTITGTDDAPVITAQDLIGAVTEQITPAGNLTDSGTITFTDVDLTDVHLVSSTGTPIGSVLGTLTAVKNTDTTGTGTGGQLTWTYTIADSAVEYLAKDQTKVESFIITLDDQNGGLITKQIDVTITGTDDAPVITAQDLIGAVTEQITPVGNLTDSGTITFTDVDLTAVHLVSATGTPIGSVLGTLTAVKNTDTTGTGTGGQLTWTYTVADSAVEYLAKDQTKVESFTITLDDQNGGLITKQIDVTITGTDDAPVITAQDLIGAVTEQITPAGNLTDSGTITFTDVDLTDVHLVSSTGTPIGSVLGTLTAVKNTDTTGTGTGGQLTWTYTIADSAVEYLAKDQTKVESFTITLDDQNGGLITRQIDVTITGTNDAPVITAQDLIGAVTEQITPVGNLTDSGTITFTDVDLTDVHLVSSTGTPIGSVLGTLTAVKNTDTTGTGTGGQLTWTYTIADSAVEYLAKDQTKVESFTITLDDQNGGLITRQVDVTITGTNDAPVITAQDLIGAVTELVTPAGNLTDSGTITFTDVDLTDVHLVSSTGTPIGSVLGTLTAVKNTDTTGTGASGQLTWTYTIADSAVEYLAKDQTKVESFTITLDDQHGGLITKQIDVTITGTDDAPVITAQDLIGAVTEQITPAGNLTDSGTITFTDVDLTDVHLVSSTGTPIGSVLGTLTAVKNTDTTGTGTGGQLTWTYTIADSAVEYLAKDQTKVESFIITLDDQHGGLITRQIDVTITGTDDAPVITAQDLIGAVTEQITPVGNLTDSGTITFSDVDLTDVHLVSATGTPIGSVLGTLTVVKNSDTTGTGTGGQLTWTYTVADSAVEFLAAGQTKVESFTITLDDQHGGLITRQIDVTITGTADARVIAPGTTLVLSGETVTDPLIQNNGTILVQSNNQSTVLGSIITGTGPGEKAIEIKNNSTLQIDGSVDSGQTVFFSVDPGGGANSKLVLTDPLNFHAKISDFSGSDQIDLGSFIVSGLIYVDDPTAINTGGTLKIFGTFNGTATELDIIFIDGEKQTGNFSFTSDGSGGTSIFDPPTSTPDATVIPVVDSSTLTATETAGSQTDVSSATADDGTVAALSASVSDPDGGETTNVTVNGDGAAAHTARIVSGPGSLMVNPGTAREFTSISHRVAGNPSDNRTVEVSNAPELGRTAPSRDRSAVNGLEGQIAIASVMLVLEYLTENFKLASDANAGTLIADPPASPDATVAAVADTRTVKAADTADTQATPVAADEGAVAAHDVAITPDGGMSDLTISGLPSDFALTENEGDEPTATHDAISLAYSEFTDHGQHGSGKDHTTAANVATTHSAEGQTAAKASVSMSSHTTSSETGSDGNSNGGDAARIHDAIAGHSSTIDTVGTTISDSVSSSLRGATSGHLNDQPHFENATPGTLQSLESPTQAALHADEGRADHSHGAAAEHSPTIDTPATTIANSDVPGFRGEGRGHVNDQPQLGNTNPADNGLGHQPRELPSQASAHAAKDVPVEDAKGDHAAHSHGAAAKDSSTFDTPATTVAETDAADVRGEPPGHGNDESQLGNADPGNNGLGHQPHELPNQASAHVGDIPPVAADEDANKGHAAHSHGADAEHSSTGDAPATTIADSDAPGVRGGPPGHGNDQPQSGNANPGNNGLGHQPSELPSQAVAPAAGDIPPVVAVEDAKGDHAASDHGAAAEPSQTIATEVASVAHGDSQGLAGAASRDPSDQFHFAYANPGTSQSVELPSQAHSHLAADIPVSTTDNSAGDGVNFNAAALPTAGADDKGDHAAADRGASAEPSQTIGTEVASVAHGDSSGLAGAASGEPNDQFHFANANPGNNGLGNQSVESPSQTASQPAVDIPAATTELAQIVDDVLTEAAQAALDPGTTPDHNSQVPWTNTDQHNRSGDFITHA